MKDKQKLLATRQRKIELMKEKAKINSRKSLIPFCKYNDQYYIPWNHHLLIAEKLEAVERGDIKRLIINCPPRHWKSRLASQEFPAWFLGKNPRKNIMLCSYSASLAEAFSRKTRDRVKNDEYREIFDVNLKDDSQSVKTWNTEDWGWFISAWVWWAITWKGFDIWIIDDPISNREEAESEVIRNKVIDWYTSTFYTRQEKDAAMIVIQTRWHEWDLSGFLQDNMANGGEKWEILDLPAISDKWEALWPEKYDVDKLEQIKQSIWPRDFNSLYQWQPFDETWGAFKKEMFQYYDYNAIKSRDLNIITFIDPAISLKESADYTAIVTIGQDSSNNIYVLDIWRQRAEPDEIITNLFKIVDDWKPERVWIETVAYQKMLALEIKKQMQLRDKWFTLDEVKPMWEKEARIKSILQPRYSNKNIYHNHNCWDLETELLRFPSARHDDISDSLSWAVKLLDVNFWDDDSSYEQALTNYLN